MNKIRQKSDGMIQSEEALASSQYAREKSRTITAN